MVRTCSYYGDGHQSISIYIPIISYDEDSKYGMTIPQQYNVKWPHIWHRTLWFPNEDGRKLKILILQYFCLFCFTPNRQSMDMFGDSIDLAIGGLWMASPFMTGFVLELYNYIIPQLPEPPCNNYWNQFLVVVIVIPTISSYFSTFSTGIYLEVYTPNQFLHSLNRVPVKTFC